MENKLTLLETADLIKEFMEIDSIKNIILKEQREKIEKVLDDAIEVQEILVEQNKEEYKSNVNCTQNQIIWNCSEKVKFN